MVQVAELRQRNTVLPKKTNKYFIIMIDEIKDFIVPIILIIAGIWLKKGLFPNTDNRGKLWLWLIVIGCLGILLRIILLLIRH